MIKTSIGVQDLRRRIATKAKTDANHRFWGLYCHVWKHDVLMHSYRMAKANRGAAGSDGKSFADIESEGLTPLIECLSQELRNGSYCPLPLRSVEIPKADGKKTRTIKIAAIRDRVVQGALKIVLEPIFEMDFQDGSFGYRPRRTAHQALARVRSGINKGLTDVIDLDLKSYFDTVKHDKLLDKLAKRISDPQILKLCKQILKSGGRRGLPQGSIVGPVFSNLYLNDVDKMLEKAQRVTSYGKDGRYETIRYVRFADDFTILVKGSKNARGKRWLEKVMFRLREELSKLDLSINEEKTKIVDLEQDETFTFLGYTFLWGNYHGKGQKRMAILRPTRSKRTEFLKKVSKTLKQNRFRSVGEVVQQKLNPLLRGWVNYFRYGNSSKDLNFVKWQVETKVRKFASRQTQNKVRRRWSTWSQKEIYGKWKLFSNYRVSYSS